MDPECVVNGCKAKQNVELIERLLKENGRLERELEEKEKLIADRLEGKT